MRSSTVHVLEIYLGVDFGLAGGVQKVRDQGEWVAILFGNFIEASEVNAELERTDLLFYKRTGAAWEEAVGRIKLVPRFSSMKVWRAESLTGDSK